MHTLLRLLIVGLAMGLGMVMGAIYAEAKEEEPPMGKAGGRTPPIRPPGAARAPKRSTAASASECKRTTRNQADPVGGSSDRASYRRARSSSRTASSSPMGARSRPVRCC